MSARLNCPGWSIVWGLLGWNERRPRAYSLIMVDRIAWNRARRQTRQEGYQAQALVGSNDSLSQGEGRPVARIHPMIHPALPSYALPARPLTEFVVHRNSPTPSFLLFCYSNSNLPRLELAVGSCSGI
ncbi:hypothetical protein BDM02DRAFT_1775121 [Thelephora ganbajun]|uniref:Uncharacterized protein n=1 Tax=Thelephora ganbajun TaxID=370292 RepID=A0ACB6YZV2_THEGA|nr:hypothetical protein BDM02DRAFT_1775121 [Thelephora ganbajun]